MVSTVQALGLLMVVVIPGAVATFGYERHVGPLATDGTDRLFRYVFGTALASPFSLFVVGTVWTRLLHVQATGSSDVYVNRWNSSLPWTATVRSGTTRNRCQ